MGSPMPSSHLTLSVTFKGQIQVHSVLKALYLVKELTELGHRLLLNINR